MGLRLLPWEMSRPLLSLEPLIISVTPRGYRIESELVTEISYHVIP